MALHDIVVNNRYRLDQRRGRGLLTDDYDAFDTLLDRSVTVKALLPDLAADKTFVDRFRLQAQAAANLTHPGLVGVLDWGREPEGIDGRPGPTYYLVTEHNPDRTLTDYVASNGPLPVERVLHVLIGVTSVLEYSHREGVVHGGITPDMITVSPKGDVKVSEVALTNAFAPDWAPPEVRWDQALWRAPENFNGVQSDAKTDVYQVGSVAYYIVTGMPPFPGETVSVVRQRTLETIPPAPIKRNPKVPKSLQTIIGKSMAKNPDERYASVAEQRNALVRLREQRVAARPEAPATPEIPEDATMALTTAAGAGLPVKAESNATEQRNAALAKIGSEASPAGPGTDVTLVAPRMRKRSVAIPDDEGRVTSDLARLDGKRKRNGLYLAVLAALLGVLALLLALLARQLGVLDNGKATIEVPNVIGQAQTEARAAIGDVGLIVDVQTAPNDKFAADVVFQTDPASGKKVAKNSKVTIFVSTGVDKPSIPSVVGDTPEVAKSKLAQAGFGMLAPVEEPNDSVAPGIVIRQDPPADSDAQPGQQVTIVIAKATGTQEVPDVATKSPDDARIDLTKIGFRVAVQQEASPTVPKGTVIRTEPAAGQKVDRGAPVIIFVSAGKGIPVPSVIGSTQEAATAALTGSGFKVDATSRQVTAAADAGRVMSQTPNAGDEAEPGATIVIRVGVLTADTTPPSTKARRPVQTDNTAVVSVADQTPAPTAATDAPAPAPEATPAPTVAPTTAPTPPPTVAATAATAPPATPAPVQVTAQPPTSTP
jgi:eukaryotic-like serine/threonine-protein kinase